MEKAHIGQELNELALKTDHFKGLLPEVVKKLTEYLRGRVGFLMTIHTGQSASWSDLNFRDQTGLVILENKLKRLMTEMFRGDENQIRDNILTLLQQNLSLKNWEICAIDQPKQLGWLVIGSDEPLGLNHHLKANIQAPLSVALQTLELKLEVEKHQRYQQLQQKVTTAIHHSQEVETLLHNTIAHTVQTLDITRGIAVMLRYAEPRFCDRREISDPNIEVQPMTQWAKTPLWEVSLNHFSLADSPLCFKAWQQAPLPLIKNTIYSFPEPLVFDAPNPVLSLLIVPLMGSNTESPNSQMVLGFLLLQDETARSWSSEEQEIVSWICDQVSMAIIQKKALERVHFLVEERTAQLQRSLDVQAKLYETTRQQVKQLKQLNQLKDQFLEGMSHQLNTPLTTMKMAIKMLSHPKLSEERREKYLTILEQEWSREHGLIQDLLLLQGVKQANTVQVDPINLEQLLTELGEEFLYQWERKGLDLVLELESESPPSLYSDTESVQRIFLELLSNAGKYARPKTTVTVRVSQNTRYHVRISITNIGYGIAPSEHNRIFEPFLQGKEAIEKTIPGTGTGLALVKALVQHLHGTIELDSQYNPEGVGETTFSVTFPRSIHEVLL